MKRMLFAVGFALVMSLVCSVQPAAASPMSLSYDITNPGTGIYGYSFSLVLDNNDNSWVSGQSWDWLVFGDAISSASPMGPYNPSNNPALGFVGNSADLPIGPWNNYNYSTGGHNGPTLVNFNGGWKPVAINETLNWSGTAPFFLGDGDLKFSTLLNYDVNGFAGWPKNDENGNRIDNNTYDGNNAFMQVAKLNNVVVTPEPASMVLFGIGGAAMAAWGRRKKA